MVRPWFVVMGLMVLIVGWCEDVCCNCDTRFFTDAALLLEMACESDVGHFEVERLGFRLSQLHRQVNNLSLQ